MLHYYALFFLYFYKKRHYYVFHIITWETKNRFSSPCFLCGLILFTLTWQHVFPVSWATWDGNILICWRNVCQHHGQKNSAGTLYLCESSPPTTTTAEYHSDDNNSNNNSYNTKYNCSRQSILGCQLSQDSDCWGLTQWPWIRIPLSAISYLEKELTICNP